MMYQFLTPKAGGLNLSQVVVPQDGMTAPRDSTIHHQSAMIAGTCVCVNSNEIEHTRVGVRGYANEQFSPLSPPKTTQDFVPSELPARHQG